jgi:hypothetical protein
VILGIAPGIKLGPPRREGEFVVNRRGRLQRFSEAGPVGFTFEADSERAPESPMVIVPCKMLESMEDFNRKRGGDQVFILSGQVLTYREVNYLLPTMVKIMVEQGNLTR